jgi:hypothetical protein
MYVIDLFKEVEAFDVVNEMIKVPYFFDYIDYDNTITDNEKNKRKYQIKLAYIDEFNSIKRKKINDFSNDVIFIHKRIEDSISYDASLFKIHKRIEDSISYDASLFKIDKLKIIKESIDIDEIENFKNPLYSVMFDERNYILGLSVSKSNIEKYGRILVASVIFNEITRLGLSEKSSINYKNKIIKELEESCKYVDNGGKTFSTEELEKELGIVDNRTKEEKDEENKKMRKNIENNIQNLIQDIKLVINDVE